MARLNSDSRRTDHELVQACCEGQTDAFGVLVERYQDRTYNAVLRMVGSREDARDIVQEAFLKAYENLSRFRGASSFYTWLFRIAMNAALTFRRRSKRLKLVRPLEDGGQMDITGTQAGRLADPAPEAAMETAERERIIGEALETLDGDHRAAIVLRDVEGLDYQAIAGILEVPAGTVKSRIHRARMMLRDRLKDVVM
jgi:RNA polymerase sigma-70 factor (ECF subfamily)